MNDSTKKRDLVKDDEILKKDQKEKVESENVRGDTNPGDDFVCHKILGKSKSKVTWELEAFEAGNLVYEFPPDANPTCHGVEAYGSGTNARDSGECQKFEMILVNYYQCEFCPSKLGTMTNYDNHLKEKHSTQITSQEIDYFKALRVTDITSFLRNT